MKLDSLKAAGDRGRKVSNLFSGIFLFQPDPFKDAEVNPEPPSKDWRDRGELALRFIWFYRRSIIGSALLAGLAVWFYLLAVNPRTDEPSQPVRVVERSSVDRRPSASLDFQVADTVEPDPAVVDLPNEVDEAREIEKPASISATSRPPQSRLEKLLATGTIVELIEESLAIRESWGKTAPGVGLMMCVERAKISRRLMEMKLSESQRLFAITSYIDSISLVDSLNVASKMEVDGTRAALLELDEMYSDHPDPTVFAKSNLVVTLAPLYDFIASGELESLEEFRTRFNQRIERIAPDQASLARLAELTIGMRNRAGLPAQREQVINELMQRFDELESESSKVVANKFREHLLYDQFELGGINNLVMQDDPIVRQTIQQFFMTLSRNPDSSLLIYQSAIDIIRVYRIVGKLDESKSLASWLREISDEITKESNKQLVKEAIDKFAPQ